tara:strand:+ start:144 stop:1310 length:1167 start_codon:yes stop_codon:yes gene_type:complete
MQTLTSKNPQKDNELLVQKRTADIKNKAFELGFSIIGSASPYPTLKQSSEMRKFIAEGMQGDMDWLAKRLEARIFPKVLWPETRTIISLGLNYGPKDNPLQGLSFPSRGVISVYARGGDYHDVIKSKTKHLAKWLISQYGGDAKIFVDTAPVMEKPIAQKAGIGWQGKHTNLVSREFGSWLFLGEIFTNLKLEISRPSKDRCGKCIKCINICPTDAIDNFGKINTKKCISYLTIEYKGHISSKYRKAMGNRIYGCDDCLAVCPWNKFGSQTNESRFIPKPEMSLPRITELLALDDTTFRSRFSKSPIKRIGRDRFIRNVLIAAGNSNDQSLVIPVYSKLRDRSSLVRAMAVWALGCLSLNKALDAKKQFFSEEIDQDVIREWKSIKNL